MLKYMTKYFDFDATAVDALKKSADGDGIPSTLEIKAKFTDETPDSHGDIITRSATEKALPDYREWRNIRYMHQPKAVGLAKNIGMGDGAELNWNEVIIKLVDKDTIHQVQEGVLKGLSVGILFNPFDGKSAEITDEGTWKINEYLLAEISVVDHPAHPNASVIEQSLGAVEDSRIDGITSELKTAIRSATSTEELVPLLKSLSQEKEEDMEKEKEVIEDREALAELEKEGRDWDKETHMPENVVEAVEVEEEEEDEEAVEEEVEAEVVEAEVEAEEPVADEVAEPVVDEEVAQPEEEEVVEEVEEPAVEEEVAEEVAEEEAVEEVIEEDEEEVVEEVEEELDSEQPLESNESEEFAITVNEDDVNARLDKIEAMLEKLLEKDAEVSEAIEVEAEIETPVVSEQEELELAENGQPSNRKTNVNMPADNVEEVEQLERTYTFRKKRTDGQTRIRQTLERFNQ